MKTDNNILEGLFWLILYFGNLYFGYHAAFQIAHKSTLTAVFWLVYYTIYFYWFTNRLFKYQDPYDNSPGLVLIAFTDLVFLIATLLLSSSGISIIIRRETNFDSDLPSILSFVWTIFIIYIFTRIIPNNKNKNEN